MASKKNNYTSLQILCYYFFHVLGPSKIALKFFSDLYIKIFLIFIFINFSILTISYLKIELFWSVELQNEYYLLRYIFPE